VHDFFDKGMSDTQEIQNAKSWAVQNFVLIHVLEQRRLFTKYLNYM